MFLFSYIIKIVWKFRLRRIRKTILYTAKSVELPLRVNGISYINNNTYLGKNVNFNGMKIMGNGKVTIGDNFHSGQDCVMITQIHNFDSGNKIPYDETLILKEIKIEDNVWIGHGVIILGTVKIGEGAIIQAGAVIVKDIPKYAIAGGNPAAVFKYRNIDHYKKLKDERKFH